MQCRAASSVSAGPAAADVAAAWSVVLNILALLLLLRAAHNGVHRRRCQDIDSGTGRQE